MQPLQGLYCLSPVNQKKFHLPEASYEAYVCSQRYLQLCYSHWYYGFACYSGFTVLGILRSSIGDKTLNQKHRHLICSPAPAGTNFGLGRLGRLGWLGDSGLHSVARHVTARQQTVRPSNCVFDSLSADARLPRVLACL